MFLSKINNPPILPTATVIGNHILVLSYYYLVVFVIQHAEGPQFGRYAAGTGDRFVRHSEQTLEDGVVRWLVAFLDRCWTPTHTVEGVVLLRVYDPLVPANFGEVDREVVPLAELSGTETFSSLIGAFLSGPAR